MSKSPFDDLFDVWVGFDRLLNRVPAVKQGTYPPHNIIRTDDEHYEIQVAVAGFMPDELDVEYQSNTLTVSGKANRDSTAEGPAYLHQGIAKRAFHRSFTLSDNMEVGTPTLVNGILTIPVTVIVPEEKKPRKIPILTDPGDDKIKKIA